MTYKELYKKGDVINGLKLVSEIWVENEKSKGMFLCVCGKEFKGNLRSIAKEGQKSCGCYQKIVASIPKNNYQKGELVGTLIFLNRVESKPGRPMANFLCLCGKEFTSSIQSVKAKDTKSCGCSKGLFITQIQTKHAPIEYIAPGVKKLPSLIQEDVDRFWAKIAITANTNSCWDWQATGDRYGGFRVGKGMYKANRIAYFLHYGEDPGEMEVMHSCDRGKCCNPKHLSLGSHWENMQDMAEKGRANPNNWKKNIVDHQNIIL